MKNKLKSPAAYSTEIHLQIIKELSAKDSTFSYLGLVRSIKDIATSLHIKMGINKAKLFAKYYYDEMEYIIKKDGGLYLLNDQYL